MKNSLFILLFLRLGCNNYPMILYQKNPEINKIGLKNAMPQKSIGIWLKAPEKDGMSLVRK
jgi:hypothetical protein